MSKHSHRLPLLDSTFLRIETSDTPMHVGMLMEFTIPRSAGPGLHHQRRGRAAGATATASPVQPGPREWPGVAVGAGSAHGQDGRHGVPRPAHGTARPGWRTCVGRAGLPPPRHRARQVAAPVDLPRHRGTRGRPLRHLRQDPPLADRRGQWDQAGDQAVGRNTRWSVAPALAAGSTVQEEGPAGEGAADSGRAPPRCRSSRFVRPGVDQTAPRRSRRARARPVRGAALGPQRTRHERASSRDPAARLGAGQGTRRTLRLLGERRVPRRLRRCLAPLPPRPRRPARTFAGRRRSGEPAGGGPGGRQRRRVRLGGTGHRHGRSRRAARSSDAVDEGGQGPPEVHDSLGTPGVHPDDHGDPHRPCS